jgi:hypothetical protein
LKTKKKLRKKTKTKIKDIIRMKKMQKEGTNMKKLKDFFKNTHKKEKNHEKNRKLEEKKRKKNSFEKLLSFVVLLQQVLLFQTHLHIAL